MAYHLTNSVFYHIPKTGGTWVVSTLKKAHIPIKGGGHSLKIKETHKNFPAICFLRHPLKWYFSRWSDPWHKSRVLKRLSSRKRHRNILDAKNRVELRNFNLWTTRVLNTNFSLTKLYINVLKKCSDYGRQENLRKDLIDFLKKTGDLKTKRQENIINKNKRIHVSGKSKHAIDPMIIKLINEKETTLIKYFYSEETSHMTLPDILKIIDV